MERRYASQATKPTMPVFTNCENTPLNGLTEPTPMPNRGELTHTLRESTMLAIRAIPSTPGRAE